MLEPIGVVIAHPGITDADTGQCAGRCFLQPDIVRKAAAAQSTAALFLRITGQRAYRTPGRTWRMGRVTGSNHTGCTWRVPVRGLAAAVAAELTGVGGAAAAYQLSAAGAGQAWGCRSWRSICRCCRSGRSCRSSLRERLPGPGRAVRWPAAGRPSGTAPVRSYRPPAAPAIFMPIKRHGGACAPDCLSCSLHGAGLCADKVRCGAGRVHKGCVALHFLEHLLVFLAGLHAGNTEGYDLNAAQLAPLGALSTSLRASASSMVGRAGRSNVCPYR